MTYFRQTVEEKYSYHGDVEIEISSDVQNGLYDSVTKFGSKSYSTPRITQKTRQVFFRAAPEGLVAVETTFFYKEEGDYVLTDHTKVLRTKLVVSSKPSRAKIFIAPAGETPVNTRLLTSETLELGVIAQTEMALILKKTGYADATRTVTVKEGEKTEIHVDMHKA